MRLRHIEIFDAICRTGSLTEAAHILHVSQPAASKLLASAENQLGFKLFNRVRGRLSPTREADILRPQISRMQQELARIRRLANSLKGNRQGHLRIGSMAGMGLRVIPAVIAESHKKNPDVTFDLYTQNSAQLIAGLMAHELDIIITYDETDYPGAHKQHLTDIELVHVGLSAHKGPKKLSDLNSVDFIALEAHALSGLALQQAFESSNIEPNIVAQVQTHFVACAMVEAGCGETIVDLLTARAMLRPGITLSRLDPQIKIPICVMTHSGDELTTLHAEIIERLQAVCLTQQLPSKADNLSS
jgi:DNA-binding transcriptional LysR family regulator